MYLIIIGALIISSLGFYAGKLLRQLKEQQRHLKTVAKQQQIKLAEHDKKILNSVVIIVRAMKEEQCDLSEGSWRISVLLDSLKTSESINQQIPSIYQLYNGIKHMPILAERKKLKKRERMKLDMERIKLENQLIEKIMPELDLLSQYSKERLSTLKTTIECAN